MSAMAPGTIRAELIGLIVDTTARRGDKTQHVYVKPLPRPRG